MSLDAKIDAAIAAVGGNGGGEYKPTRTGLKVKGKATAALEPDGMRAYLLTHPLSRGGRLWCDRILEGVNRGERNALRLFSEAMKWTGATVNIGQVLFQRIGVRDEAELVDLADSGRRLRSLQRDATAAPEAFFEEALALVEDCIKLDPARRQAALARLGGMPTEAA